MERFYVMSSDIKSIGFEEASGTLEIEFLDGSILQYHNVPKIAHLALMTARAKGLHFRSYIQGKFPETKIADARE